MRITRCESERLLIHWRECSGLENVLGVDRSVSHGPTVNSPFRFAVSALWVVRVDVTEMAAKCRIALCVKHAVCA